MTKLALKKEDEDFEGLTLRECATLCDQDRCVITGQNVCGHPRKGGLQASHMMNRKVVDRFNAAKRYLKRQELDAEA
jgi:hypothetical protein